MGDKRAIDAPIPLKFWWAKGHAALEQEWRTGDFSTTVDQACVAALGVTFDLRGICEMLPAETAAIVSRRLSVAGNPAWLSAQAARAFMYNELRAQPVTAGDLLVDQCRAGFVAARAIMMQRMDSKDDDDWAVELREWDVPTWYWEDFTTKGASQQNWERGLFSGRGRAPTGLCSMTLTGVHFAKSSMQAMLPSTEADPPSVAASPPGGLPYASYWDDLWCAVWGDIFRGDFKPTTQADVERAMLDWASANDEALSESGAKPRARKLFTEYRREGNNT